MCVTPQTRIFGFTVSRMLWNSQPKLREEQVFHHLKAVEFMLLIPIMSMDNARPLRRFSGKEDHFTELLFHHEYFSVSILGSDLVLTQICCTASKLSSGENYTCMRTRSDSKMATEK